MTSALVPGHQDRTCTPWVCTCQLLSLALRCVQGQCGSVGTNSVIFSWLLPLVWWSDFHHKDAVLSYQDTQDTQDGKYSWTHVKFHTFALQKVVWPKTWPAWVLVAAIPCWTNGTRCRDVLVFMYLLLLGGVVVCLFTSLFFSFFLSYFILWMSIWILLIVAWAFIN